MSTTRLAACSLPPPPAADLALRNGRLLTMDGARPEVQALAARAPHRLVGADEDAARYIGPLPERSTFRAVWRSPASSKRTATSSASATAGSASS
jgi:hypothetical protein